MKTNAGAEQPVGCDVQFGGRIESDDCGPDTLMTACEKKMKQQQRQKQLQ